MTTSAVTSRPQSLTLGVVKAMRPKQWAKNSLLFVAPVAAGALFSNGSDGFAIHGRAILQTLLGFVVFCMIASGTYLINDSVDVEADRRHPTKRNRPIAAGIVSIQLALTLAILLIAGGLALALWRDWRFLLVALLYVIQTTAYSFWLKNQPVLDLVALSGGFILRLLAGAVVVSVGISDWFFVISCFGALFIAVGKRMAEKRELGDDPTLIRKTLAAYSESYLKFLQAVSAGIVLIAYVEWALDRARVLADAHHVLAAVLTETSILPFVVAILRYALLVEGGQGSAPEDVLGRDRQMQIMGLVWVLLAGVGFAYGS